MSELIALLDRDEIGVVRQRAGRLSFAYREAWRSSPRAYPLSLSLPLAAVEHGHAAVHAFLWGLLPDNERVLERWGREFHVSAGNAFALLGAVGEDCAGAVRFVKPERLEQAQRRAGEGIEWLSKHDVAERLRLLTEDATAWRRSADEGQFSLAGAQPKTALYFDGKRWGIPSGRTPTTHILKPTLPRMDGHAENEHLCLALARSLGLAVTRTKVQRFEATTAIVVERYDRVAHGAEVRRIHQEDLCQALGRHPTRKYENEGGPSALDIVELLRAAVFGGDDGSGAAAETDVWSFVEALAFNWLIGGTDAHAKNYSLLIGPGLVRLAPLYDVASTFAFSHVSSRKAKLAMKLGGSYRLEEIGLTEFRAFAKAARLDEAELVERVRSLAARLPPALADELDRMRQQKLVQPALERLSAHLVKRASLVGP